MQIGLPCSVTGCVGSWAFLQNVVPTRGQKPSSDTLVVFQPPPVLLCMRPGFAAKRCSRTWSEALLKQAGGVPTQALEAPELMVAHSGFIVDEKPDSGVLIVLLCLGFPGS